MRTNRGRSLNRAAFSCLKMSDQVILPTADAVIGPVLEKLYERRPTSFQHLNLRSGRYWHPVLGYRGQTALMLKRLASLVEAHGLSTASGQDLIDYVESEFFLSVDTSRTFAQGFIDLGRSAEEELPSGDWPKGTKFTRTSYVANGVSVVSAEYETLADAHFPVGSTATVRIPCKATREGAGSNAPILIGADPTKNINIPNLVENVFVSDFQAAGGSDSTTDDFIKLFARSCSIGEYGPTQFASRLGALASPGVRHILVYDDTTTGTQNIAVADASWASGERWASQVRQNIYDSGLLGHGCKVAVLKLRNRVIVVDATISLRDTAYLTETTDVDLAVQKAVRAYFDDRVDWNVWNTQSLRSAISRAHSKIYMCTGAVVKDAATGQVLTEILRPDYTAEQVHLYLASNAMKLSYVGPT